MRTSLGAVTALAGSLAITSLIWGASQATSSPMPTPVPTKGIVALVGHGGGGGGGGGGHGGGGGGGGHGGGGGCPMGQRHERAYAHVADDAMRRATERFGEKERRSNATATG